MQTIQNMAGTIGWSAPELFQQKGFTTKSDVYSMVASLSLFLLFFLLISVCVGMRLAQAIVMWEIVNRVIKGVYERPYSEYTDIKMDFIIMIKASEEHLRPTIPPTCFPPLRRLIQRMWDPLPERRPTAEFVIAELQQIQDHLNKFPEDFTRTEPWPADDPQPPPQQPQQPAPSSPASSPQPSPQEKGEEKETLAAPEKEKLVEEKKVEQQQQQPTQEKISEAPSEDPQAQM
jgi:serine/threonine protein kinase